MVALYDELEVNLDSFYRLLWRHILTVELLKIKYDLSSERKSNKIWEQICQWVNPNDVRRRALDYFHDWGGKFWLATDEHLRQMTEKFNEQVKSACSANLGLANISVSLVKSMSSEERTEAKSLATSIVNDIQLNKLKEVVELLANKVFDDKQKRYYVLIDQLDENWARKDTRHKFIRALIEEIKFFRNIEQVKIIIALRTDLLAAVFDRTRSAGFQQEKYEAYLSPIKWSKDDLVQVLNDRVNTVFRRQYTKENIQIDDMFPSPKKCTQEIATDYVLDRTLLRPRDAIQFANECFSAAQSRQRISWKAISDAERTYSTKRLQSLFEEWDDYYPALKISIEVLRGLPVSFKRSSIDDSRIDRVSNSLFDQSENDPCVRVTNRLTKPTKPATSADLRSELLICLYQVGAIGMKIGSSNSYIWSYLNQSTVTKSEVTRANQFKVHKMLVQALEIRIST